MAKAADASRLAKFGAFLLAAPRRTLQGSFLKASYQREVFLVAAFGVSAFYLTALATFHPLDASWVSAGFPTVKAYNWAGAAGAHLSGAALFAFGLAAWILPAPLLTTAILAVRRTSATIGRSQLAGWLLSICTFACFLAMIKPEVEIHGFYLPTGGYLGIEARQFLLHWLGSVGSGIALATIALCAGMLVSRKSFIAPGTQKLVGFVGLHRQDQKNQIQNQYQEQEPRRGLPLLHWLRRQQTASDASPDSKTDESSTNETDAPPVFSAPELMSTGPNQPGTTTQPSATLDNSQKNGHPSQNPQIDFAEVPKAPDPEAFFADLKRATTPGACKTPVAASKAYVPPPVDIFKSSAGDRSALSSKELESTAALLVRTFADFGVSGKIVGYQPGPVVTVFEFQPEAGVKQAKVMGLIDDLALTLKVDSIFIHPVRGKRALGIQVPNSHRETVWLGDVIASEEFTASPAPLTFAMGKSLNGQPVSSDLATMPHLLMAGATGAGKSVAINALLSSIIMKSSPDDVKMILVDPKMLELSVYEGIPHLLMPVITEAPRASLALKWAAHEMERRYKIMQGACVRNVGGFNAFWEKATEAQKQEVREAAGDDQIGKLPSILLVIDELADLMMTAPKDVEANIQRLAQKARASGIHMVLATQRPSVDVITGVIKANLPSRVAFQVVSKHDSRTILDINGAEKLLGKGDMLFQRPGAGRLERVQGALVTDEEVLALVAAVKAKGHAVYDDSISQWIDAELSKQSDKGDTSQEQGSVDDDPRWDEAISMAQKHGVVSASFLQRHLKIGYNRAARMVESMQSQGLVAKAEGAKPRKWLGPMP